LITLLLEVAALVVEQAPCSNLAEPVVEQAVSVLELH
jgi:hypothetical protein